MCGPVMGILGAGMSLIGGIAQGNAAKQAADAKAAESAANASLQRRQAGIEQTTSQYQQAQKEVQLRKLEGNQINAYAGSGLTLSGSPTDVITDATREGMLDVAAIRWNSDLKAGNLNYQGAINDMNAANQRKAGSLAQTAGIISGISGAVKAFGGLGDTTSLGLKF